MDDEEKMPEIFYLSKDLVQGFVKEIEYMKTINAGNFLRETSLVFDDEVYKIKFEIKLKKSRKR